MTEPRVVERFKIRTVWLHWVHTAAFLILIVTGAILFFPGIGVIAAGGWTRILHRVIAVIFIAVPFIYIPFNFKEVLHFLKETLFGWGKGDIAWGMRAPDYYFGGPEEKMPPQGHANTGQKMWQLVVIGTGVIFLVTGAIMWFFKGSVSPDIFRWCLAIHGFAFLIALVMLLVHVYMSVLHPRMGESFRSMVDGKISVTYAKHHYGKWYAEMSGDESHEDAESH